MAGYSGTPLFKKLGIKPGHHLALINAPADFTLEGLPPGLEVRVDLRSRDTLDVIVFFVTQRAVLEKNLAPVRKRMAPAAGFWVAWPKRASGVATDITENVVREIALPTGLVDNKVCAIDQTWSGLRLVIRLSER